MPIGLGGRAAERSDRPRPEQVQPGKTALDQVVEEFMRQIIEGSGARQLTAAFGTPGANIQLVDLLHDATLTGPVEYDRRSSRGRRLGRAGKPDPLSLEGAFSSPDTNDGPAGWKPALPSARRAGGGQSRHPPSY